MDSRCPLSERAYRLPGGLNAPGEFDARSSFEWWESRATEYRRRDPVEESENPGLPMPKVELPGHVRFDIRQVAGLQANTTDPPRPGTPTLMM